MPDHGKDLGADLYHLWLAGNDNLPAVADEYRRTADDLSNIDNDIYRAMWRPARFGGDDYGTVFYAWTALRDELQSMLSDTATNLTLTGEALCLATNVYAKTDDAASDEMRRLIEVDGVVS